VVRRSGEALCQGDRQRARPTRVRSIAPVRQLVPYPGSSVSPAWLALTADGVLHFWGRTPTRSSATPTPIARGVEQLFAGSHSVIARFRDGVARRIVLHEGAIDWVEGIYGETIELPALVGAVGPRRQVCAWTQAGAVLCRGRGLEQVGVDREDEWTRIEGLGGVEEVVSFGEGFCARSGEAVHCWGHRLLFEGNGDPPPAGLYRMPGRFTQLQASFRRVLATRTDGYAEAWGMIGSREQPRVVPDEGEPADGVWLLAGGEVVFARSGRLRLVRRSGSEPLHVTVSGARVVQGLPHGAARCALDGEGRVFCWGEGVALGLSDRFSRVGL